jgi:hypothetical protein
VFNSLVSSGVLDVPPAFSLDPPPRPFLTLSPALDRDALGLGPIEGSDEEPQQQEENGEGVQAQEGQQGEEEGAERSEEEGAKQRLVAILNARPRRYRLRTIASYALPARCVCVRVRVRVCVCVCVVHLRCYPCCLRPLVQYNLTAHRC